MSGTLAWIVVGLGLLVVVVRRRSLAVALVTGQALLLAGKAFADASSAPQVGAAVALALRAVALAVVVLVLVARTREPRPIPSGAAPLARGFAAVAVALVFGWLVPAPLVGPPALQRAVVALVAFGAVTVATRRATLFQVLGVVLVENGVALAALRLPSGATLIELGVAFDLTLVSLVAAVFHERIFAEFGAADTASLRSLRDHP